MRDVGEAGGGRAEAGPPDRPRLAARLQILEDGLVGLAPVSGFLQLHIIAYRRN